MEPPPFTMRRQFFILTTQFVVVLLLGCMAIKERHPVESCQHVHIWLTVCTAKAAVVLLLHTIQGLSKSLMGCIGLMGLGLATTATKCSLQNPVLWWTAMMTAWLVFISVVAHFCASFSSANEDEEDALDKLGYYDDVATYSTDWADDEYTCDKQVDIFGTSEPLI